MSLDIDFGIEKDPANQTVESVHALFAYDERDLSYIAFHLCVR